MNRSKDVFRHSSRHERTIYSAEMIVNLLDEFISPSSVVDIGCGVGTFLSVFESKGVEVLGLDSFEYVDKNNLVIHEERFIDCNLEAPPSLDKKYDLVISLEVAEHLRPQYANRFVEYLATSSDVVCFSAAIPGQGGKGHYNEQWIHFWDGLFKKQGYVMIDCIRPFIWNDTRVFDWYKMNCVIYVRSSSPLVSKLREAEVPPIISMVHPERFIKVVEENERLKNQINSSRIHKLYKLFNRYFSS